jgi:hypothetical protein
VRGRSLPARAVHAALSLALASLALVCTPAPPADGAPPHRGPAVGYAATYRAPSGDTVRVALAPGYGRDDAAIQSWGATVAGFVHGSEIRTVTVYVAPPAQIRGECGGAVACYDPDLRYLLVPGSDPGAGGPLQEIVAHEYGHHIAASRRNPPWDAYEWGTKRWASYEDVCSRVRAHTLFPGSQGADYARNPGEAFAEAYRVLNGGSWSGVVDPSFLPDATALQLLRADIVTPWRRGRTVVRRGTAPARVRVDTTLDGRMAARAGGRRLVVRDAGSGRVIGSGRGRARATVCGQDAVTVGVGGQGHFTLRVSVP